MNNQRQPPKVGDVSHALERFLQFRFCNSLHLGAIFGRIFDLIRSFTSFLQASFACRFRTSFSLMNHNVSHRFAASPHRFPFNQKNKPYSILFHYPTFRPYSTAGSLFVFRQVLPRRVPRAAGRCGP